MAEDGDDEGEQEKIEEDVVVERERSEEELAEDLRLRSMFTEPGVWVLGKRRIWMGLRIQEERRRPIRGCV